MKLILFASLLSLFACKKKEAANPSLLPSIEQAFVNGKIYTINESQPWAEAMLVRNGVIVAIGTEEEVEEEMTLAGEKVDLKGRMVMPGIHDVHVHPLEAASENFQFILDEAETDTEGYLPEIEKALAANQSSEWILGWGFDIFTMLDSGREPVELLDEVSNTKPIAVMELTSHSIWVNSKALELAGITRNSADPEGGVIMKDANGNPNGLLIDNAGNLIIDLAVASIPNSETNDYFGLVDYALPELNKYGITSVCDARAYWKRNHHLTWLKAEAEGALTVRVNLGLWVYPSENDASQIAKLTSLYSNNPASLVKINQLKFYADGIVINTTSAMHDDFLIDLFDKETNNGLNYLTQERMSKYIAALEPVGFDFHIHAIGDRGVHEALNAIEQNGTSAGRHRLTHVEYVSPKDLPRFAQLNVTADAQVAGDFSNPENWHENDEFVIPALNTSIIPLKSLQEADARITLSSDWDVSSLNPFVGIENAVTRSPQELSLENAVKAYTINAAYVMRQEDLVGSLEVGKQADFIVLDQNIFEVATTQISQTVVLETYLWGELVYPF